MRSRIALAVGVALLAAACGGGGSPDAASSDGATSSGASSSGAASSAPAFVAAQLAGGELDSASFAGRDVVLWFWAPWCSVCRAEAPNVTAAATTFDGTVEVIGVAGRGQVSEMQAFVDATGTGGLNHIVDVDGSIWSDYGVFAQPSFAFVSDTGEVEVFVGALGEKALTERMTALAEA